MPQYAALLGHQPALSLAELRAMLPDILDVNQYGKYFVTFGTNEKLDQEWLNTIGGTVMLAKQITENAVEFADIHTLLARECENVSGKVTFSFRTEGVPRSKVRDLYRECKQALKHGRQPSRYIGNEKSPALPVQLHQEGMITGEGGCEIVILADGKRKWIGRTVGAQDTKAYTLRDVEKPVRDRTVGILPPKLAQMLLNFGAFLVREKNGELPSKPMVLDPFCGSGVIPMEAMLRRWDVLGSDVSSKAVSGCEKNIEWMRKTFKLPKKDVEATVEKHDACKPFTFKKMPDVVVSETSLGPNLKNNPNAKDAQKMCRDIEALDAEFLKNAAATLPGVPLALTFPVWFTKARMFRLEKIFDVCDKLGYRRILPPGVDPSAPDRLTLLYRRNDQFVGHEIVLLLPR